MFQDLPKGCKRDATGVKDLLVHNVNTWGNIQYNIPLRISSNETRTATNIALRHIPAISKSTNCEIKEPIPEEMTSRDMVVEKEVYKTTTGEYCVKPNPNKAMERADCAINCRRVSFMTGVEKRLQGKTIKQLGIMSEMKDNYRGVIPPESDLPITPPDPGYICDVVASGRNETPSIPEDCGGFRKQLDPYLTTYRNYHRPFATNEHFGIGAKDHITFYTEINLPRVRGFGPRYKEIWMPLTAKVHRAVYDRSYVKKEFKEVAASHNPVSYVKSAFESETKRKYKVPFAVSPLASWGPDEHFDSPPFAPNPYQTNAAPFMYCSDYCTIAQGTPTCIAVDQHKTHFPPHKPCQQRYIVSKDANAF